MARYAGSASTGGQQSPAGMLSPRVGAGTADMRHMLLVTRSLWCDLVFCGSPSASKSGAWCGRKYCVEQP